MKRSIFLALVFLSSGAFSQKPSGEEVLRKAEQNFQGVKDYTVTLDIVSDIERMKVPPMRATMYFKQPEKVHFDAKGFVFLPRDGMGVQFGQLTRRYVVDSIARETAGGSVLYRLALHPRDETAVIRRVFMWIEGSRWTPERLLIPQSDGRAVEVRFTYGQTGGYWLPSRLTVLFTAAGKDSAAPAQSPNPFSRDRPTGPRGNTRAGTVTVSYSDYLVNTGLSDSLFESDQHK